MRNLVRGLALIGAVGCEVVFAACSSGLTAPSSTNGPVPITFRASTGVGAHVSTYSESDFTVSANPGDWLVVTTYGNPAPFIQFVASAGTAPTAQVAVSAAAHAPFRFQSVDLYSSVTRIPYEITGVRNDQAVFTLSDTLPNTFGAFRTVVNSHSADLIDTLIIRLTNATPACCNNPMGPRQHRARSVTSENFYTSSAPPRFRSISRLTSPARYSRSTGLQMNSSQPTRRARS